MNHVNDPAAHQAHLRRVFIAMFLAALNLRPAITSLSTVLDNVRADLGLSATATGVLVMLPVLCFGIFAPLAPRLLRYTSADRIVLLGLLALTAGLGLRSLFGTAGMFAGTLISGAAISIALVVLPSIIKREYGQGAGPIMGFYSMSLCLGAALAAGATVPLQDLPHSHWRLALAFWLLPAIAAAMLWLRPATPSHAQAPTAHAAGSPAPAAHRTHGILREPLAWMVTFYMGLQSFLNYCVFTWLPAMLMDRGMTPLQAGLALSVSLAVQLITSIAAPWLGSRGKDQRLSISLMMLMTTFGLLGVLYAPPSWLWACILVMGLGQGGTFSLALTLLVLRAPTPTVAASLSGMAQGIGYAVAALGPFLVGVLYGASGEWHGVAVMVMVVSVLAWLCGMGAGRARLLFDSERRSATHR